jgi:phosphoribosylanthranilate isomerase
MVPVKVCGIRRLEDARAALEEGAWALGFIFHRPSPRYIEPEEARAIIRELPRGALAVGVFVDWPIEALNGVVEEVGLGAAQLHGTEPPGYAARVRAAEVWKAFRVDGRFDPAVVELYPPPARVLLDAYREGVPGGTGETCDWELARRVQAERPIVLAGGLGPGNIVEALRRVEPQAVDVSSGVETEPGVKDRRKLSELFAALRGLERARSAGS